MKKQDYCKQRYPEGSETSTARPKWQWLRTCYIALLTLMMLFMVAVPEAKAVDHYMNASNAQLKVDIDNGYIEVSGIDYYESEGSDEWLEDSYLEVKDVNVTHTVKVKFYSNQQTADGGAYWSIKKDNNQIGNVYTRRKSDGNLLPLYTNDYIKVYNSNNNNTKRTSGNIRWYLPKNLYGKKLSVNLVLKIEVNNDNKGAFTSENIFDNQIFTFTGATTIDGYKNELKKNAENVLKHVFSFNASDHFDEKYLIDTKYNKEGTSTRYFREYDILDYIQTTNIKYYYPRLSEHRQMVEEDVKSALDTSYTIPAYHQARNFRATYSKATGKVSLSWYVNNASETNCIKDDQFEIQASTDKKFTTPRTLQLVDFSVGKQNYIITDDVAALSNNKEMYYRIRRTYAKVDWVLYSTTSVSLSLAEHVKIDSATARLDEKTSTAIITWPNATGHWSDNTIMTIEKRNLITGGLIENLELTKEEWVEGKYVDDALSSCISYSYRLQIKPGNTIFPREKAVTATGEVLISDVGKLLTLKASKGYYPDRISLQWSTEGKFDQFVVRRTQYAQKSDTVQLALIPASSSDLYTFDDDKNVAGTYYTYLIVGLIECGGERRVSKEVLNEVGFRSPQGNIYGSVTYENGQAVEDVQIRLEQDGNNIALGSSILFSGAANSGLSVKNMSEAINNNAFTFQTWIKPTDASPTNQVLFSAANQYEIGFDDAGELYLKQGSMELIKTPYKFDNSKFVHVSVVCSSDSVYVYAGDSVLNKMELSTLSITPKKEFFLGSKGIAIGNAYKGHMDEVRIWNRALTHKEIEQDHKRLITGNEKNLIAYYRFDEIVNHAFYDISYKGDIYNENHGEIKGDAKHNSDIPDNEQLSLKGITNESGNYFINGVPYTGNGTQYKIIPRMGTHQFDPTNQTRFIGGNSLSHEGNFKDKSSFPVSGYVYYSNTTVPVQGVMFKIDGTFANDGKGNLITSDAKGAFAINVPVGYHEVKAEKANHIFEGNGRITDIDGRDLNYQGAVKERQLYDNTTVRFVGRIGGGAIEEAYPLGHSLSTNNLGDNPTIKMEIVPEGGFTSYDITNVHFKPKDADKRPNSSRWEDKKTKVSVDGKINTKIIIIEADKTTGEFVVDLIPEKFRVNSVSTNGHSEILKNPMTIDLSNKLVLQKELYEYRDSIFVKDKQVYTQYSDTVSFHDSYKFIKRVDPTLDIVQLNRKGVPVAYLGNDSISFSNLLGETFTYAVYAEKQYRFSYPVFTMGTAYTFKATAYESYKYNNDASKESKVPTADGIVKINNGLRSGTVGIDEVELNNKGEALYTFRAGDPNLSDGIKNFGISVDFSGQSVSWNNGKNQEAYVLGAKSTGNDIVTEGPNRLITILRDPPGSQSYAYFEKGSVFTSSNAETVSVNTDGSVATEVSLGGDIVTTVGVGFTLETEISNTMDMGLKAIYSTNNEWGNVTTSSVAISEQISTSTDPLYVGDAADVLVGNSTNISYGIAQTISIVKTKDVVEDGTNKDEVFKGLPDISLVRRNALSSTTSFVTMFAYPQIHIEDVLIPNLIRLRDGMLMPQGTEEAQEIANYNNKTVYVSNLTELDEGYGASNNDANVFGAKANAAIQVNGPSYHIYYPNDDVPEGETALADSIHYYNQSIGNWISLLAQNEKSKIDAAVKLKNYTFHAASNIEYSEEYSYERSENSSFQYVLGSEITAKLGLTISGIGLTVETAHQTTAGEGRESSTTAGNTIREGFVLAEEGSDYISVDVFRETNADYDSGAIKGPFVYRTKGGVTSCPYEGGYISKYYRPGTVISEPTLRMEVPKISVDKSLVKNVPSNRKAVFKLLLENQSESRDDMYYTLNLLDKSNPHGAALSIDGMPLGNNGRTILVPYGEIMGKTLEVARGPQEMNYNDLQLILASQCQYDPTDFLENIADTVIFSAHFVPSCSEIQIKQPLDKWIINTNSKFDINTKGYILPIVLNQFDVNNSSLERFEIQVKQEDESVWTTQRVFYLDPALAVGKSNAETVDMDASEIKYDFVMDGMSDSRYDVRAVSICKVLNEEILTYSEIVSGTKDAQRPTLFGSVQPANGILDIDTEILLNFNEIIKEGALARSNFTVTGIRNGSKTDHGVSVLFDGVDNYIASEVERNLSDKDITIEMWVLRSATNAATLFSHGNVNESIELGFSTSNRLELRVGASVIESSSLTILDGQWAHVAMVYKAETQTVSAYYNFANVMNNAEVANYKGQGNWELGRSIKHGGRYFAGQMHEVRVWTKERSSGDLQINSLKSLTGLETGLLIYYPMSEGKGKVAFDKARGANGIISAEWKTPAGKAIALDGTSSLKIASGSTIAIDSEMDYTLEFWFKADKDQTDVALITNELVQDGHESFENRFFVGFNNAGKLIFRSNGNETIVESKNRQNYRNNIWHHFAASVNRTFQKLEIYVDDEMISQLRTDNVGGIGSDYITVGAKRSLDAMNNDSFDKYFKGSIDEVRVWNTSFNDKLISKNSNVRLNGQEMGLLAYYPFEEWIDHQNNKELRYTLKDMKVQKDPTIVVPPSIASNSLKEISNTAPIKDRGPVENLSYSYVISDKSLLINLEETPEVIEKSTVTFSVDGVQDMFGNRIKSPITWSAYIDRNLLKWDTDEINESIIVSQPLEFKAIIVNNGGRVEKYSLENLPRWITALPEEGTINPKSRQVITFMVDQGLNVGSYNEIVYMRNSNNVTEPLALNVKVNGTKPNWNVDPGKFEYNMSVYGQLRISNIFSNDKEDILAAFINGECVGTTNNVYNSKADKWYAFLTIYGNKVNENASIEFRIWDASTGKTFLAQTTEAITFKNQRIYGTSSTPLIFDTSELCFQNFKLNKGWNWISFNVTSKNLSSVQQTLGTNWNAADIVKNENHFDSFSSANKKWLGTLSQNKGFNNTSAFMLKTASEKDMSVIGSGLDVKSVSIAIKGNAWNYISYLPSINMTVDEALAGYAALDGDIIKSQEGFSMFNGNTWIGSLNYMEPNKGYMLYRTATDGVNFKYSSISGSLRSTKAYSTVAPNDFVYRNYNYLNNMTVVAKVVGGVHLQPSDLLIAYVDGEKRGASQLNVESGENLYFTNVISDKTGSLRFGIERDGEIIARTGNVASYQIDARKGDLNSPLELNFETSIDGLSVYPNPFKDLLNIKISLQQDSDVSMNIYTLGGALVKSYKASLLKEGEHIKVWDASAQSNGLYIVTISVDGVISSFKVIKQ